MLTWARFAISEHAIFAFTPEWTRRIDAYALQSEAVMSPCCTFIDIYKRVSVMVKLII